MKFKVFSKIRFFFLIYSVMIFSACHDSDKIEPEYGERTVLIYMAADNNLNKDGETNIKSILKGMEQTAGRLVIYIDPRYDVPCLLTVKGGKGCRLDTLETYTEENSASPEVLARVVKEVQKDIRPLPMGWYCGRMVWGGCRRNIPSRGDMRCGCLIRICRGRNIMPKTNIPEQRGRLIWISGRWLPACPDISVLSFGMYVLWEVSRWLTN